MYLGKKVFRLGWVFLVFACVSVFLFQNSYSMEKVAGGTNLDKLNLVFPVNFSEKEKRFIDSLSETDLEKLIRVIKLIAERNKSQNLFQTQGLTNQTILPPSRLQALQQPNNSSLNQFPQIPNFNIIGFGSGPNSTGNQFSPIQNASFINPQSSILQPLANLFTQQPPAQVSPSEDVPPPKEGIHINRSTNNINTANMIAKNPGTILFGKGVIMYHCGIYPEGSISFFGYGARVCDKFCGLGMSKYLMQTLFAPEIRGQVGVNADNCLRSKTMDRLVEVWGNGKCEVVPVVDAGYNANNMSLIHTGNGSLVDLTSCLMNRLGIADTKKKGEIPVAIRVLNPGEKGCKDPSPQEIAIMKNDVIGKKYSCR